MVGLQNCIGVSIRLILLPWLIFLAKVGASPASTVSDFKKNSNLNSYETVELTNPIRLESVSDLFPYESVVKLIISVKRPKFDSAQANQIVQSAFLNIKETISKMSKTEPGLQSAFSDEPRRSRRFKNPTKFPTITRSDSNHAPINSILSRLSHSIVGNEDLIRSYFNILDDNKIPGFSTSLVNSTDFQTTMTHILDEIMEEDTLTEQNHHEEISLNISSRSDIIEKSIMKPYLNDEKALKFKNIIENNLKVAIESCQQRKLPSNLVEMFLKQTLLEMQFNSSTKGEKSNILPNGFKFVISPTEKFQLYLNQSLTDCLFTPDRIYVVVNLPVIRQRSKWQIYRSLHSTFVFDEKICTIGSVDESSDTNSNSKLYAFDKSQEITIDLSMSRTKYSCQWDHRDRAVGRNRNQLCFIPPTQVYKVNEKKDSSSNSKTYDSFTCAAGILNKVPLKDLKQMCNFGCVRLAEDGEGQYFEQLTKNQILLTNVRKLKVACPHVNFSKTFERIGGLKISLPSSNCFVWADDQLYSFHNSDFDNNQHEFNGNDDDETDDDDTMSSGSDEEFDKDKTSVEVSYLIPITWTKNTEYNMLVEDNISFKIKNHKEIIDYDWFQASNSEDNSFVAKYFNFFQDDDYYSDS